MYLSIAFHDKDKEWINDAANRVWKNLGYTGSEYAHMNSILKSKIEVINNEFSDDVFNENEHSVIVSGHSSNWEIPGMALRSKMNRVSATETFLPFFFISSINVSNVEVLPVPPIFILPMHMMGTLNFLFS